MGCLIALSLPFVAFGLFSAVTDPTGTGGLIGIPCVLFFGSLGGFAFSRLRDRKPVIRIDDEGIYWRLWSDAVIAWKDIELIEVGNAHAWGSCLCIHLRDPEQYPPSGMLGRVAGAHARPDVGDIAISPTGTNKSWSELTDALSRYLPRLD
jgi:hypothetical protein